MAFLPFHLAGKHLICKKKNYIKEPIKKLFENTLNRIMQNSTYT